MKDKQWRIILVIVMFLTALSTPVSADRNVPPVTPVPLPSENVPHPAPHLQPPPPNVQGLTGGIGINTIVTDPVIDMKVLVIRSPGHADGVYATIQAALDILGTPYGVIDISAGSQPSGTIQASDLWDGVNHGYYYAIFVTTSNVWAWLHANDKAAIEAYERDFDVRHVTWYTYPNPTDYGLNSVGSPTFPLDTFLTTGGQEVFSYLRTDITLTMSFDVWGYLAQPATGADVTSLLEDDIGNTVLAIFRPGDGREHMVFTMSSFYPVIPPSNIHARVLPYGMINWATRGVFLGERHAYFVPQPDDILAWGDRWDAVNHVYIMDTGYRLAPHDLDNVVTWMNTLRTSVPNAAGFMMEMPFNGDGSEQDREDYGTGPVISGTLTAKAMDLEAEFTWLNHTYTHLDFDHPPANYNECRYEIDQNNQTAAFLGFTDYTTATLLTGAYSGLTNTHLISAAYDLGVRYLLANESDLRYKNPSPNTGIPHPLNPEILQVPRYANNIFYAATTPAEETDLYNHIYSTSYTYTTILDITTNQSLGFLLDFSVDPTMFHMNNINDYGGGQTLLGDFTESLYGKYNALYNTDVPIISLRTQDIGQKMWDRMAYNNSGVSGIIACGNQITLNTTNAAAIPLTGISYGGNVENYAGQNISYIPMGSSDTVSIPGAAPKTPAQITGLSATRDGDDRVLSWDATTQDTGGAPLTALTYRVYGIENGNPYFEPAAGNLLAETTGLAFTHTNAINAAWAYAVTAVGDNCWKRESEPARHDYPNVVTLASFTASPAEGAVILEWKTATETDNLGFNLYRAESSTGPRTQLNESLLPSQSPGSMLGAPYGFRDETVTEGVTYYYWLEDVDLYGESTSHGPLGIKFAPGSSVIAFSSSQTWPTSERNLLSIVGLLVSLAAATWVWRKRG